MNRVRGNSWIGLAILMLAVVTLFPVTGWAQGFVSGEFKLSQSVRWEDSVLPMGDYEYSIESNHSSSLVRVQRKGGGFSGVFTPQAFVRHDQLDNNGIALTGDGGGSYVSSLSLRSLGGELVFPAPGAPAGPQSGNPTRRGENVAATVRALQYFTIVNLGHEKISTDAAEKVYLGACEAVQKEFNRETPIRPPLTLRLGVAQDGLRFQTREIRLKKWDEYRFADAVVDLVLFDMVPREERVRLRNAAVSGATATVSVCELKACVN